MKSIQTGRGFGYVEHPPYVASDDYDRLISESSAVGEYPDSLDNPGSSFLWVGEHHHLDREEVAELIGRMQEWLTTGQLAIDDPADAVEPITNPQLPTAADLREARSRSKYQHNLSAAARAAGLVPSALHMIEGGERAPTADEAAALGDLYEHGTRRTT